jgi:hypothetical protein
MTLRQTEMGDSSGARRQADQEDYDDFDCCPNCGGEGYVYVCFEEYACIDPEGGCDLCMRRCDWCNLPKRRPTAGIETEGGNEVPSRSAESPPEGDAQNPATNTIGERP